jgi:two-component sensor histidine kinase
MTETFRPENVSTAQAGADNQAVAANLCADDEQSRELEQLKELERQLRESLQDRERLLKETHHRMKNNLQVVLSLLTLQGERADDPKLRHALQSCSQRVASLALVHEKLHSTGDFRCVDLADLAKSIATMAIAGTTSGSTTTVKTQFDVEPVAVDHRKAFPISLILNELIANALTHAFVGRTHGTLRVSVQQVGTDRVRLSVADDGVGGLAAVDVKSGPTLGMSIVANLARQLDGELNIGDDAGSNVTVTFATGAPAP